MDAAVAEPYGRVLIAVDASDEADQVLEAAARLNPRSEESFYVVTVVPPIMDGVSGLGDGAFAASWPLKEMEATINREITDSVRERVARFGIMPDRVTVLYGRAPTEIHAYAQQIDAELIVLGSHGRHGLARVILGSTALGVLHGAPCDVLTVRIHE